MGRSFEVRKASMAKTSAAKSKIYGRYGKELYVCAKNGGADPDGNLSLRRLIEKAKKDQVPAHVIDNALKKASGGGGEDFQPALYEGFGPGNCMVLIACLTDNVNRTIGEVRGCFTKTNSKIGAPGSVAHMFDHHVILAFEHDDEEAVLEALMEADVDVTDIEAEEGMITVFTPPNEYNKARTALTDTFGDINFEMDEITYTPQTYTDLSGDDITMFEKFIGLLNDCDDVQNIYHNAQY